MSPEAVSEIRALLINDPQRRAGRTVGREDMDHHDQEVNRLGEVWVNELKELLTHHDDASFSWDLGEWERRALSKGFYPVDDHLPCIPHFDPTTHAHSLYWHPDGLMLFVASQDQYRNSPKISSWLLFNWELQQDLTDAWSLARLQEAEVAARYPDGIPAEVRADLWGRPEIRRLLRSAFDIRTLGIGRWISEQGKMTYAGFAMADYGFDYHLSRIRLNACGHLLPQWKVFPVQELAPEVFNVADPDWLKRNDWLFDALGRSRQNSHSLVG